MTRIRSVFEITPRALKLIHPHGKVSTDVERTLHFGLMWNFSDILFRYTHRKWRCHDVLSKWEVRMTFKGRFGLKERHTHFHTDPKYEFMSLSQVHTTFILLTTLKHYNGAVSGSLRLRNWIWYKIKQSQRNFYHRDYFISYKFKFRRRIEPLTASYYL